jgi:hypothetical protein
MDDHYLIPVSALFKPDCVYDEDGYRVNVPAPNFCSDCGAEVWPLKGTDVLTCKRGHHQPNLWS